MFKSVNVEGFKFVLLSPEEHIQTFWNGGHFYEADLIKYIYKNYSGGTFVDVGANMGNHTLAFSRSATTVVSFEPVIPLFKHMMMNIILNEIENIVPYNCALGNENGVTGMFVGDFSKNAGGCAVGRNQQTNIIPLCKLDDFQLTDVTLIKIDVETYELEVLKGAVKTIEKYSPDLFVEAGTPEAFTEIDTYLKEFGYKPVQVFNATPTILWTKR